MPNYSRERIGVRLRLRVRIRVRGAVKHAHGRKNSGKGPRMERKIGTNNTIQDDCEAKQRKSKVRI
jgi:hypothetical protein